MICAYTVEVMYFIILLLLMPLLVFSIRAVYYEIKHPYKPYREWICWGFIASFLWAAFIYLVLRGVGVIY